MTYLARVFVTLKPAVNDPQGLTIRGGLHALGFGEVGAVRAVGAGRGSRALAGSCYRGCTRLQELARDRFLSTVCLPAGPPQ
jgi:hypothetical protein